MLSIRETKTYEIQGLGWGQGAAGQGRTLHGSEASERAVSVTRVQGEEPAVGEQGLQSRQQRLRQHASSGLRSRFRSK